MKHRQPRASSPQVRFDAPPLQPADADDRGQQEQVGDRVREVRGERQLVAAADDADDRAEHERGADGAGGERRGRRVRRHEPVGAADARARQGDDAAEGEDREQQVAGVGG